jgi:tetratricopeptide (TPR) repeat protein
MVKAWREIVTIPTYEIGKAEKNPIFLEKRVYQGSSGVVYPYPVVETMSDEKVDKDYRAIWLENEYIKVMVLPELGGRIQMAYDKIAKRHFVYYNHVIKPALVGLTGPWISGGIEFNWPQHHRPTTFMPVDTYIEENADGSVTVWVSEMEKMFHQKGMAGFTLRPGCAYLEIKGRLYNRTDVPQTFLWWANPAVEVNDQYQSVFPPDINAVFDHGKRAVSSFPIATGTYYKMDYSAGVDISNYKNIFVPTSYMGVNSRFNFEGGYENDTKAGMLHVASHHFSPGKKQWTWGNGDFGRAWDRNLTDEATPEEMKQWGIDRKGFRPYIELMAGVYTENQPDFSWLMPYEEKMFTQYFMPYRELGIVKEASKDLIFNINSLTPDPSPKGEGSSHLVEFKVFATNKQEVCIILRNDDGEVYYKKEMTLSPETVLTETVNVKDAKFNQLTFEIVKTFVYGQRVVLQWHAEADEIRPIPDSAEAALLPEQIKTNEQLYLTGLHLEQYRHATWLATDYYEEALRRDPNDIRCLNALGLWYIRKGRFAKAEDYLRKAVKLSQKRNPNPYDGEPIYNLALALKYQGKTSEAYELFWKATWNKAWADAGYFEAAKISTMQGRYEDALDEVNRCLNNNWHNHKARALKAAILRKLGETSDALALIDESLEYDLFNYGCRYEQYLIEQDEDMLAEMKQMLRRSAQNYDEVALDYVAAGLTDEARAIWQIAIEERQRVGDGTSGMGATTPMTYYYMGRYDEAEKADSTYCFPNRPEDIIALEAAKRANPQGARAPYYLGCLYYAARQYDLAIENWEHSARLDPEFPTVWRNLALGRFNKQDKQQEALEYMERAFHLDENDERILMELDQLYKRLHRPHEERLAFLQKYPGLIQRRDDLVLEEITLLNQLGRYDEAMQKLDARIFHPWEGGEGKVPTQYQVCRVELAKQAIVDKDYEKAVKLLNECLEYPHHLGEGKLYGAQENDFYYLLGVAYDALGNNGRALECWEEATKGPQEPAAAMYYNDAKPDKIFYQGLALYKLGRDGEAHGRFYRLINYGKQHIFGGLRGDEQSSGRKQIMDYFAVSLPDLLIWEDSLDTKNLIHCKYMLALGYYGMGDMEHAERYLKEVEALDNNHQGIQQFRTLINAGL